MHIPENFTLEDNVLNTLNISKETLQDLVNAGLVSQFEDNWGLKYYDVSKLMGDSSNVIPMPLQSARKIANHHLKLGEFQSQQSTVQQIMFMLVVKSFTWATQAVDKLPTTAELSQKEMNFVRAYQSVILSATKLFDSATAAKAQSLGLTELLEMLDTLKQQGIDISAVVESLTKLKSS